MESWKGEMGGGRLVWENGYLGTERLIANVCVCVCEYRVNFQNTCVIISHDQNHLSNFKNPRLGLSSFNHF